MTLGPTPETPEPSGAVLRARRSILAGGLVGAATAVGLLALVVAGRLLTEYLGLNVVVGIALFGLGVGLAVTVLDWKLE